MYARIFSRSASGSIGVAAIASAAIGRPSAVQLGGDDIQAPQDGHDVGDQVILDDVREDLEVDERRRAGPGAPGRLAAVGDEVVAELSVGRLDRRIELVSGRLEAAV